MNPSGSVLFVGESPPPGAPPDFRPFDCASGTRLATLMLGLHGREEVLAHIPRRNLFDVPTGPKGCPAWDPEAAREAARVRVLTYAHPSIVCLGRKVAEAFYIPMPVPDKAVNWAPMIGATWGAPRNEDCGGVHIIYVPHPSGASSALTPAVRTEVRQALIPELVLGCPTLRPWHFRLDDPAVFHDLATALAPLCPAAGAAVIRHIESQRILSRARMAAPLLARIAGDDDGHRQSWDYSLAALARELCVHDGLRRLGNEWHTHHTILANARSYAALNAYPRHVIRATLGRYMQGGIL